MRIYLTQAMEVAMVRQSGRLLPVSFPRRGFYNVQEEIGRAWMAEGIAYEATEDNKALGWRPGCDAADLVDVAAGESLAGLFPNPQPLPTAEESEPAGELETSETDFGVMESVADGPKVSVGAGVDGSAESEEEVSDGR